MQSLTPRTQPTVYRVTHAARYVPPARCWSVRLRRHVKQPRFAITPQAPVIAAQTSQKLTALCGLRAAWLPIDRPKCTPILAYRCMYILYVVSL
jgi:hypothetical protein